MTEPAIVQQIESEVIQLTPVENIKEESATTEGASSKEEVESEVIQLTPVEDIKTESAKTEDASTKEEAKPATIEKKSTETKGDEKDIISMDEVGCAYKFAKLLTERPYHVFGGILTFVLILSAIGSDGFFITIATGTARNAYAPPGDVRTKRADAWILTQEANLVSTRQEPIRETMSMLSNLVIMYSNDYSSKDTIFTEDTLTKMRDMELAVFQDEVYQSLCWLCGSDWTNVVGCTNSTDCRIPLSPIRFFFPSFGEDGSPIYDGRGSFTTDLPATLELMSSDDIVSMYNPEGSSFHLVSTFGPNTNYKSTSTRTLFYYGLPLEGYLSQTDDSAAQARAADDNSIDLAVNIVLPWEEETGQEIFAMGGLGYVEWLIEADLLADAMLAFVSINMVFFVLVLHLKSVFLAGMGIIQIMLCFPVAIFWTFDVLGVTYFDTLNTFLLFVILGIGADDIFVYYDAWRQSASMQFASDVHRTLYVFKRASGAMLVTSLTTFFAFIVSAFSQLPPTQAFGIFAGLLILTNYLLVISFFPAAVLIHERCFLGKPLCLCCDRALCKEKVCRALPPDAPAQEQNDKQWIEVFFKNSFLPFLQTAKLYILAVGLVFFAIGVSFAVQIEADTQAPDFFGPNHEFTRLTDVSETFFGSTLDLIVELQFVWGVKAYPDNQGHSAFDFGSEECGFSICGTHIVDQSFSFATEEDQLFIEALCDQGVENAYSRDNGIPKSCFVHDLRDWRIAANLSYPIPADELPDALTTFFADPTYFFSYIANKRISFDNATQTIDYMSVGFSVDFLVLEFYPWSSVEDLYDWFMAFEATQMSAAPAGLKGGFLVEEINGPMFVNSWVARLFTQSAVTNVLLAGAAALCVLFFATQNWRLALMSFFSILVVVVMVLGIMVLFGWKVGLIEAMCMSLIVGFSVDYIVHIAHAYSHDDGSGQHHHSRIERVYHSLETMGVSVVAGFVTTFCASVVLIFTRLVFFKRFGIYICLTIVWAVLVSLFLFSSLLLVMGPEEDQGDMRSLCGTKPSSADQPTATTAATATATDKNTPAATEQEKQAEQEA